MSKAGYKVTITGTLPVDVTSIKELQRTAALIATAQGGDASGVLKRLEDVSVQISDGSKPGRKPGRKAKAGEDKAPRKRKGKKRGRKPKQGTLPLEPAAAAQPAPPPAPENE